MEPFQNITELHNVRRTQISTNEFTASMSVKNLCSSKDEARCLQDKLYIASKEIIKMKVSNETIISQYNEELKETKTIVEEQKNAICALQREKEKLESDNKNEMRYREDLKNKVTATREICETLENHVNALTVLFNNCQQDVCTIENSYKRASTVIEELKTQKVNYKVELDNLQSLLTHERQIKEEMCINWKGTQISLEQITKQFNDQLKLKDCEINQTNQERNQYYEKLAEAKICNENLLKTINEKIKYIDEKDELLISIQNQFCTLEENASLANTKFAKDVKQKDKEINLLKTSFDSVKSHQESLIDELNKTKILMNEELTLKEEKIKQMNTTLEHLENQLKITKAAKDESMENENKLKQIILLQNEQNNELELSTECHKQENSELKNKIAEFDSKMCQKIELCLNEKNMLIGENQIHIKKISELELELQNMQNKYELQQETLLKEMKLLKENLDEKETKIMCDMERYNSLQRNFDHTAKENMLLKQDIANYQTEVSLRNDKIIELKNEVKKLKDEADKPQPIVSENTCENVSHKYFKGTTSSLLKKETACNSKEKSQNAYDLFVMSDSGNDELNSPRRKRRSTNQRKVIYNFDELFNDEDEVEESTKPKFYRRQTKSAPNNKK